MPISTEYRAHVGADLARFYKTTLFQSPRMLVGLDCLEPGQSEPPHRHNGRDKLFFVVEGSARFADIAWELVQAGARFPVGGETTEAGEGAAVWAPAGVEHGVANTGERRLVMLIAMAPEPG